MWEITIPIHSVDIDVANARCIFKVTKYHCAGGGTHRRPIVRAMRSARGTLWEYAQSLRGGAFVAAPTLVHG